MKTFLSLTFFSILFTGCSKKIVPIEAGKYSYYGKQFIGYLKVDIELFANDSIKVGTYQGHSYRTCGGLTRRIKNNTYQLICFDTRRYNQDTSIFTNPDNLIQRFNIENDTLVYHRSYVKFWGVKLKRVAL